MMLLLVSWRWVSLLKKELRPGMRICRFREEGEVRVGHAPAVVARAKRSGSAWKRMFAGLDSFSAASLRTVFR